MDIQKVTIENYKNINSLEIQSDGKNITLRGKNGAGKTAIMEAIFKLLRGKGFIIPDAVKHGQEEARITVDIGNNKVEFSLRAVIKKDGDYSLKFAQVLPNGKIGKYQDGMTGFIKSLFYEYSIDPVKFLELSGEEQVKMLFKLIPEIETPIKNIDLEKLAIQGERSDNLKEQKKVEGELLVTKFTPDLPESEIDPAELMAEMEKGVNHNKQLDRLIDLRRNTEWQCSLKNQELETCNELISITNNDLIALQKKLEDLEEKRQSLLSLIAEKQKQTLNTTKQIDEFQKITLTPIQEKINNLKSTNEKIRANQKRFSLEQKLSTLKQTFSADLIRMNAKEQKKIDIIKSAKMPIEGLTIGESCLMVPDPATGELVNIKNLSTGQSIPVCVKILASFLPKAEEGIRAMAVNLNEVDEDNFKVLMQAGKENEIQFVMHETLKQSDSSEIEVLITE